MKSEFLALRARPALKITVFVVAALLICLVGTFQPVGAKEVVFATRWIEIGNKAVKVEIADSPEKFARGLMFRENLSEDEGMLFVFQETKIQHFWMKNTKIALSIGFFDTQQRLMEFVDMEPGYGKSNEKLRVYSSRRPAKFALEVKQGWFRKNKIDVGRSFNWTSRDSRTKD